MSVTSERVERTPAMGRGEAATTGRGETMILVENLVKRYPKRPVNAVDGVSFEVARGEAFGLLGPNGAGKSTTIGILTTRVRPTGGRALVAGIDVARDPVGAKSHFAVVPQRNNLDRSLTAKQNLVFHAAYFGFSRREREERAEVLLKQFGLGDRGGDKVDRYSGGMAQRLMIARALMHAPDLLVLDEPTTGLDPQARLFVWDRVKDLKAQGLTVLLTTHDMDEAESLCGRVAIMDNGKILALDTPDALKTMIPGASALEVRVAFAGDEANTGDSQEVQSLVDALGALPGVERAERAQRPKPAAPGGPPPGVGGAGRGGPPPGVGGPWGGTIAASAPEDDLPLIRLYAADSAALIAPVAGLVAEHGAAVRDLRVAQASLEDVFIHLTGRGLR